MNEITEPGKGHERAKKKKVRKNVLHLTRAHDLVTRAHELIISCARVIKSCTFSTNVFKLDPKNDVITNVINLSKITTTMNYKWSRTGNNSAMN